MHPCQNECTFTKVHQFEHLISCYHIQLNIGGKRFVNHCNLVCVLHVIFLTTLTLQNANDPK